MRVPETGSHKNFDGTSKISPRMYGVGEERVDRSSNSVPGSTKNTVKRSYRRVPVRSRHGGGGSEIVVSHQTCTGVTACLVSHDDPALVLAPPNFPSLVYRHDPSGVVVEVLAPLSLRNFPFVPGVFANPPWSLPDSSVDLPLPGTPTRVSHHSNLVEGRHP